MFVFCKMSHNPASTTCRPQKAKCRPYNHSQYNHGRCVWSDDRLREGWHFLHCMPSFNIHRRSSASDELLPLTTVVVMSAFRCSACVPSTSSSVFFVANLSPSPFWISSVRRSHFSRQTITDSALSSQSNVPFSKTFLLRHALKLKSGAISWLHTRINMRLLVMSHFTTLQQTEDFLDHADHRLFHFTTRNFMTSSIVVIGADFWKLLLDAQLLLSFLPHFLSFPSPPSLPSFIFTPPLSHG